ncbi:MAG: hypothetical protein KGH79_01275 [Patescibacteria group bacterium]|nr:hypothetical protein [Patescibacteria group bacterium]
MRIPSSPKFLPKQVYARRRFSTADMMEILSIYHGAVAEMYPRTWQYRTLIIIHRDQNSTNGNSNSKGYSPDWKSLKKKKVDGKERWMQDGGYAIKHDVIEYAQKGRLPLRVLQLAASELCRVQMALWVNARVRRHVQRQKQWLLAAE